MMKRYVLSLILVLVCVSNLLAQSTAVQVFDVRRYGAKGDDSTDDTTAVQNAFTAAAASTYPAEVVIPRGIYRVAGPAAGACITVAGSNMVVSGEGTLKLASGDDADYIMYVTGSYNTIRDIALDGNEAGVPTGDGVGLYIEGDYNTISNVYASNTTDDSSAGSTFSVRQGTIGTLFEDCTSFESGYKAIDDRGDFTVIRNFRAIDFQNHAYARGGNNTELLTVDGFYSKSTTTTSSGFLIDPGVDDSVGGTDGYILKRANLKNITIDFRGNTTAGNGCKFARCEELSVDGLTVMQDGADDYHSVRLAEGLGRVTIKNSSIGADIAQDPSPYQTQDDLTGATIGSTGGGTSGFARFACTGHGLRTGDVIAITGSTSYDGLHKVRVVPTTGTFETDWAFTNGDATGHFETTIGDLTIEDTTIGTIGQTSPISCLEYIRAYRAKFSRLWLLNFSTAGIYLDDPAEYPHAGFESIEVDNCKFVSNRSGSSHHAIKSLTTPFTTAGVIRWGSNTVRNIGTNACLLTEATTLPVLTRNGGSPIRSLTANETLTSAESGYIYSVDTANLVMTLPSVASTSLGGGSITYTFILNSGGLSTGAGFKLSPNGNDKIMGNGFVSADNQDAILDGDVDREGDMITIVSDGVNGWNIVNYVGDWTSQNGQKTRIDPITMVADTTEQQYTASGVDDLISYTLPANSIDRVGGSLEIEAGFTFAANGANKQVKLLIGGNEYYASGAVAQNGGSMVLKMTVFCDSATITKFSSTVQTTGSGAIPNVALVNGGLMTITDANIIKCTGEATTTGDIVQEYLRVRVLPAP